MKIYRFFGDLDYKTTADIIKFLVECKKDKEDAVILIDSRGGNTSGANAIYETLRDTKVHLTTIGLGSVASAAAAIFAMGNERILLPGAEYLVHKARAYWENVRFQEYDHEFQKERLKGINERFAVMFEKTDITMKVIDAKCDRGSDWILTPEEIEHYKITTRSYEGWTDILIDGMSKESE